MALVSGTAEVLEHMDPTAIGSFFGNNVLYLCLKLDNPQKFGDKELHILPVKLESFYRLPNFEAYQIKLSGEYDEKDDVFRADFLTVDSLGVAIGAARRFSLLSAILRVFGGLLLIALGMIAVQAIAGYSFYGIANATLHPIVGYLFVALAWISFVALLWVVAIYIVQSSLGTIHEKISRFVRRYTEHQSHAS